MGAIRLASAGLLLALACLPLRSAAQFGIAPTDSMVSVFAVDSLTRLFQIDFPNLTEDSLGLSWRWIDGGWTDTWDVNLCDLGECYTGVPSDADMLPMGPDGTGFLKLIVNSLETEGQCFLHFWVWPTGNQDALVHVYFDLRNDPAVSHMDRVEGHPIRVYPSPARVGERVTVAWPGGSPAPAMQLFTLSGTLVPCPVHRDGAYWTLETAAMAPGVYLLFTESFQPPVRLILE